MRLTPTPPEAGPQVAPPIGLKRPRTAEGWSSSPSAPAQALEVTGEPVLPPETRTAALKRPGICRRPPPRPGPREIFLRCCCPWSAPGRVILSDMLKLDQDLEADLGIDSIKRVEILGAFQAQTGLQTARDGSFLRH